uniref:Mono-ADP ribosylhydrolase 1 n=1 Tax=Oryzias latipes TaxID=8090 RepID=A0A3P9I856_ORYLA
MALKLSALGSHIRLHMHRLHAGFQKDSVKFKHTLSAWNSPVIIPAWSNINAAVTAKKSSLVGSELWKSSQANTSPPTEWKRSLLGKFALGAALGVGTVTVVRSVHTEAVTAMALKVNLDSADGDWKKTKDFLLSLSVEDRRHYYKTSGSVQLDDIPVWTPASGVSVRARYQKNEKLDRKISLYCGDITKLKVDAIVNAANKTLLGGGGVDGAIHRAAGPMLKKECASLHGCETGEAKITGGYSLPAKYVIHTVGPIIQGGVEEGERRALRSCYKNSLQTATEKAARSVAFPCISTGIYGYPPEQAVHEALASVREYLDAHHDKLDRVIFCVFLPADKELYLQNLPLYFPAEATVKSKL